MPTKRRTAKTREYPLNPDVIAAFVAGDEKAIRQLWGIKPWQHPSPIEATGPCPYPSGTGGAHWWPIAVKLRSELADAAGGEPCL